MDHPRLYEVYSQIKGLPRAERAAAVARLCAGDTRLEGEVRRLLDAMPLTPVSGAFTPSDTTAFVPKAGGADPQAGARAALGGGAAAPLGVPAAGGSSGAERAPLIGSPASQPRGGGSGTPPASPPERFGPYKVIGSLGQGGMGEVFAAMRDDGVSSRRVAIKVMQRGMDDEGRRRFLQEQRVLGFLDHPNIASMLDSGFADDGRPYIVMEYVEGQRIDEYCTANRLPVADRLGLFRQVCGAVAFAHQRLIVHRDLKPANILVTTDGRVKLLDFGIAKLLDPDMSPLPVFTSREMRLMTPDYASPEQVRREPITTASDVYSLGVVLYELITGSRPYSFRTRMEDEVRRIVCEQEPDRPSTAISRTEIISSGSGERRTLDLRERARLHGASPANYRRLVTGELEDIVLMALRKEPPRRYKSVDALADDLRRWLEGDPIAARPESIVYRARKFAAKHRGPIAATGVVLASMLIGLAVSLVAWNRAVASQRTAEEQRALAIQAEERTRAERNASVRLLQGLLTGTLAEVQKLRDSGDAQKAIAKASIDYLSRQQPPKPGDVPAQLSMALAYEALASALGGTRGVSEGNAAAARDAVNNAATIRRDIAKQETQNATWRIALANTLLLAGDIEQSARNRDSAVAAYRDAIAQVKPLAAQGASASGGTNTVGGTGAMGDANATGATIAAAQQTLYTAQTALADLLRLRPAGAADEARTLYLEALELKKSAAAAAPSSADAQLALARAYAKLGLWERDAKQDHGASLEWFDKAVTLRRTVLATKPRDVTFRRNAMIGLEQLGVAQRESGRHAEALATLRESLATARDFSGDGTTEDVTAIRNVLRISAETLRARVAILLGTSDGAGTGSPDAGRGGTGAARSGTPAGGVAAPTDPDARAKEIESLVQDATALVADAERQRARPLFKDDADLGNCLADALEALGDAQVLAGDATIAKGSFGRAVEIKRAARATDASAPDLVRDREIARLEAKLAAK